MKIAVFSDTRFPTSADFPGHGLGKVNLAIAEGLQARGHEVTLFAGYGSVFTGPLVMKSHETEFYANGVDGYDAIIDGGHEHQASKRFPDAPIINLSHDREHAPGANAVFPSEAHRAYHKQPGRVIYLGIDPDTYPLYSGPRENYVAWMAPPLAHKGPMAAIQAAQLAGVLLKMAGEPKSWPGVECIGPISGAAKVAFLQRARALLVPASIESGGLTCLESAACGTPVIAFRLSSLPEYVADGITGWLVEDIDGMAAAIERADTLDPQRAHAWVAEYRGVARMIDEFEQAARDVARGERW